MTSSSLRATSEIPSTPSSARLGAAGCELLNSASVGDRLAVQRVSCFDVCGILHHPLHAHCRQPETRRVEPTSLAAVLTGVIRMPWHVAAHSMRFQSEGEPGAYIFLGQLPSGLIQNVSVQLGFFPNCLNPLSLLVVAPYSNS